MSLADSLYEKSWHSRSFLVLLFITSSNERQPAESRCSSNKAVNFHKIPRNLVN